MLENRSKGWFVVQTLSGKEKLAILNLQRQAFNAWCPMIWKKVRHARKTTNQQKPLFPGYLFVEIDLDTQRWRSIDGTWGVTRLVKVADRPARTPDNLVSRLIDLTDTFGSVSFDIMFKPGEDVRIISGPLDAWIGKVVCMPDTERVTLLLDMMSRKVRVTVDKGDLIKAA